MTNLLVKLTLILATNWTSVEVGTQELGYVQTNHVLTVEYQQTTNTFVLLSEPSNIAVYRTKVTNPWTNWGIITNLYVPPAKDIFFNLPCLLTNLVYSFQ